MTKRARQTQEANCTPTRVLHARSDGCFHREGLYVISPRGKETSNGSARKLWPREIPADLVERKFFATALLMHAQDGKWEVTLPNLRRPADSPKR